jgi:hypothetical protein
MQEHGRQDSRYFRDLDLPGHLRSKSNIRSGSAVNMASPEEYLKTDDV